MVNSGEDQSKGLSDGKMYLISNWAVFDLCTALITTGLAWDFHGIFFKAVTIPAGEHRIKLCSSQFCFTQLLDFIPEKNMQYFDLIVILSSDYD